MRATSINPLDMQIRRGDYRDLVPLPAVIGHDVSGVVEAVGDAVAEFAPGDEVYYTPRIFGGPGTRIDLPLGHVNAAYVRSHFDAIEIGVPDGPRPDELLFAIAMACGPRIHDRMGGLAAADISVWDGQR